MSKIIIDTPKGSYYYCGSCLNRTQPFSTGCSTCSSNFESAHEIAMSERFDFNAPLLEQINDKSLHLNSSTAYQFTNKIEVAGEQATYYYCKNCRSSNLRSAQKCSSCNRPFLGMSTVKAETKAETLLKNKDISQDFDNRSTFSNPKTEPIRSYSPTFEQEEATESPLHKEEIQYGGFWIRASAAMLDSALLALFYLGFIVLVIITFEEQYYINYEGFDLFFDIIGLFAAWLYYSGMESSKYQATLGKTWLGLKVVDQNYSRISFTQASGRYLASFISAFLLLIGYIMVAFTPEKRGLHDYMAGTYVIKEKR